MPKEDELLEQIQALKDENQQLIKYKKRLQFIERISREAIAVFAEDHRCIDFSSKMCEMFGYSQDEIIGLYALEFIAPESREIAKKHMLANTSEQYEALMKRQDGSTFWAIVQGEGFEYEGKNIRVVTTRDITEQKAIQDKALVLNAEYETIFDNSQVGILLLSEDRIIQRANHKIAEIFGYESGNDFVGESVRILHLSKESYDEFATYYSTILLEGKTINAEYQFKRSDGNPIWLSISGRVIDLDGRASLDKGVVWVFEDIEEKKQAEADLQEAYNELEIIFENAMMGIMLLKGGRIIQRVNHIMAVMFGYESTEEMEGKSVEMLHISEREFIEIGKRLNNTLGIQEVDAVDIKLKKKDGTPLWVTISGKAIDKNVPANLDLGVIWTIMDITKRKDAEAKLIELSRIDALTGIYNRRYFYELAELELEIHKRYNRSFALISIDLDYFKRINDTYGHAVGDRSLAFFARICKEIIRSTDIFGRLGGEEFGICLLEVELEQAVSIAEKIRKKLSRILPDAFEGIPMLTISAGVVVVDKYEDIENAMKRSDELLYKAKENGRDCVVS